MVAEFYAVLQNASQEVLDIRTVLVDAGDASLRIPSSRSWCGRGAIWSKPSLARSPYHDKPDTSDVFQICCKLSSSHTIIDARTLQTGTHRPMLFNVKFQSLSCLRVLGIVVRQWAGHEGV